MKIRYHLQRGPHYKHWQLKHKDAVSYHDPSSCLITLFNCVLHNNRKIADKIFMGSNKDVCAWIRFKDYVIGYDESFQRQPPIKYNIFYNPRKLPYWHLKDGSNVDGHAYKTLYLTKDGVFFNPIEPL